MLDLDVLAGVGQAARLGRAQGVIVTGIAAAGTEQQRQGDRQRLRQLLDSGRQPVGGGGNRGSALPARQGSPPRYCDPLIPADATPDLADAYFGGEANVTREDSVRLSGGWLGAGLSVHWSP